MHGTSTLLLGPVGTGKTTALKTWLEIPEITIFGLFTEPSFEVILDVKCDRMHYAYNPPMDTDFADMIHSAKLINTLTIKQLANLDDINKGKYTEFIRTLNNLSNFKCDRCGKQFGAVDSWGNDRVLWFDSLSGLNVQAMNLVVGSKPMKAVADWGIAMDNEERLIQKLAATLDCQFVMTGHLEPERDEVTGSVFQMAAMLGKKLAPRVPRFFSDVIMTKRVGDKFAWSTTALGIDLKARNLPFSDDLKPTFVPLYQTWKARIAKGDTIEGQATRVEEPKGLAVQAAAIANASKPAGAVVGSGG